MIRKVEIHNFKQFESVAFELSESVVFIGPNNAGKTSIFQALSLWEVGVTKYIEAKRMGRLNRSKGVTLNRTSLTNTPIDNMRLMWRNQVTTTKTKSGSPKHVPLEIAIWGKNKGTEWKCTAQFFYYNEESFTCKIVDDENFVSLIDSVVPVRFCFLQTMSGISSREDKLTTGSIARYMGEGKTAEVIRNLCYNMLYPEVAEHESAEAEEKWTKLVLLLKRMFGVTLQKPIYIRETGVIELFYETGKHVYPVSAAGRGFQQILLLLTYILSNIKTVLLLDEPDAHLEIVRQREIFSLINEIASKNDTQVLIASHSEVVLDSAQQSNTDVVAVIEQKAYQISTKNENRSVREALTMYGWDRYAAARMYGHILFLEGETDLKMLMALAEKLKHPIKEFFQKVNVWYIHSNTYYESVHIFEAFHTFFPELKGLAVFDRLKNVNQNPKMEIISLRKRELENYFAIPEVLYRYAESLSERQGVEKIQLRKWMEDSVADNTIPAMLKNMDDVRWSEIKMSDDWLDVIMPDFNNKLPHPYNGKNFKTNYYQLVQFADAKCIDKEISVVLDKIRVLLA